MKIIETDIFIAGAGASGIGAAVASSDLGLSVFVAEKNPFAGGNATAAAVGTICGLYFRLNAEHPKFVMSGFPKQFGEQLLKVNNKKPIKFSDGLWFIPSHPDDFKEAANHFLNHQNITLSYNQKIIGVKKEGKKITEINLCGNGEELTIHPKEVIDCSGSAAVCSLVNHEMIRDLEYQAAAIVFSVENISASDEFNLSYILLKQISKYIEEKIIPVHYNLLSVVPGSLYERQVMMKLGLPWNINTSSSDNIQHETDARKLVLELMQFLKENVSAFQNSNIEWIAKEVGVRTGHRAKGKSILSDTDVLNCIKYDDSVCNGSWPVEFWQTGNKKVEMTFMPENDFYSIRAGCLISDEIDNLFFAGKIISANEKAIASARVIGTCLGTGYAAGVLAAYKIRNQNLKEALNYINQNMLIH